MSKLFERLDVETVGLVLESNELMDREKVKMIDYLLFLEKEQPDDYDDFVNKMKTESLLELFREHVSYRYPSRKSSSNFPIIPPTIII